MRVWFTSDTHFGHANVIRYSNRPYRDVEEMDYAMIARWNALVAPDDTVYHLGDVSFSPVERTKSILRQLNGRKTLIFGNHDKKLRRDEFAEFFVERTDYKVIKVGKQHIVLFHFPIMSWDGMKYSWHLHGHSHGNLRRPFDNRYMDVGVDPNNYAPLSFEDVKRYMDKRKTQFADHHEDRG